MVRRIPTWLLILYAVVGSGLLVVGVYLATRVGQAQADERLYESTRVCIVAVMPSAVSTSCRPQVPATVIDTRVAGSKSHTYDVKVELPNGSTQWVNSVTHTVYSHVRPGSAVQVRLWRRDVTWIEDQVGFSSTSLAQPGRQVQNDAFGSWYLGMCGILLLGYVALSVRRRKLVDALAETPTFPTVTGTYRAVPTLGAGVCVVACSVYVASFTAVLVNVTTASGIAAVGVLGLVGGAILCAVLRASATLTVTPTGVELSRWGSAPVAVPFTLIRRVRQGKSSVLRAADRTVPTGALRFGTIVNDPAILAILARSGGGWVRDRPGVMSEVPGLR